MAGPGSIVEINDGNVGENLEAIDADVFVRGGVVDDFVGLFPGSTMEISAGEVGRMKVMSGASLTVSGGSVEYVDAETEPGAEIYVQGGTLGFARVSGLLHITGGSVAATGYPGSHIILENGRIHDRLDVEDSVVDVLGGQMDRGVFIGNDVQFNVSGGTILGSAEIRDAEVNISGGQLGANWHVFNSGRVEVTDGVIGDDWLFDRYSDLIVHGGEIGAGLHFRAEAKAVISGGDFLGATFGRHSIAHFVGTSFLLDDQPIPGLEMNGDFVRFKGMSGSVLRATLLDGRSWEIVFDEDTLEGVPFTIDPDGNVWLTLLIPEPAAMLLALLALPALSLCRQRRWCRGNI